MLREYWPLFGVLILFLLSFPVGYVILRVSGALAIRKHKKLEGLVRPLIEGGFVLSDAGGMTIWPLELEFKDTQKLRALLNVREEEPDELWDLIEEAYEDRKFCGVIANHIVSLTRERPRMFSADEGPARLNVLVHLLNPQCDREALDHKLFVGHECSVEPDDKAVPFDTGNEWFDSFFSFRVGSQKSAKLFQSAGARLDEMARIFSKWEDKLSYVGVGRFVKIGILADAVLDAKEPFVVAEEIMNDTVKLAEAFEAVLAPGVAATEISWVDRPVFARFEVLSSCPKCNAGMPLNGPVRTQQCHACLSELKFDDDHWDMLTSPREDFLEGSGGLECGFGRSATTLHWEIDVPSCHKCGAVLPVETVAVGSTGVVRCSTCGVETPTFPAPEWLRNVAPGIEQLYGAERASQEADPVVADVDQEARRPINMVCPGCGGKLVITSESERTTDCEYCGNAIFLPDQLWMKLHPAKATKSWWARFSPPLPS